MDAVQFALNVHIIITGHGGSVTSWIRSEKRNRDVGGAPGSLHTYGLAVDVVFDDVTDKLRAMIQFRRAGLYALQESDHVHVQAWPLLPPPPGTTP